MTKGMEPAVLNAMAVGLHRMKENVSSCRSAEPARRRAAPRDHHEVAAV
jgi:hypothetical protein